MINIQVKGLDKLLRNFDTLSIEMKLMITDAIKKSALLIESKAKPITPVDTGRLRSSITSAITPMEAIVAPHTEYAIFVHEGTRYMGPRPFMEIGAEKAFPEIRKVFEDAINIILSKMK